jgi:hypothetical protein
VDPNEARKSNRLKARKSNWLSAAFSAGVGASHLLVDADCRMALAELEAARVEDKEVS